MESMNPSAHPVRKRNKLKDAWNRLKWLLVPRVIGFDTRYQVGTPLLDQQGCKRHKQIIGVTYTFTVRWLFIFQTTQSQWVPAEKLTALTQAMEAINA